MITEVLMDIVSWSKSRPIWQRHALHKLCLENDLTEADIMSLIKICKQNETNEILLTENDIQVKNIGNKVILKSIHSVANVNALAKNQRLQFYPTGLTTVYGDNGSGKTGYIRILKQICRARNPKHETILPNIYENNPGITTAKIIFISDNKEYEVEWIKDQITNSLLSSISVFDSTTASVHVETTNDVAYVPFPMELLKKLVNVCILIKEKFQNEINILKAQTPTAIKSPKCSTNSPVGLIIHNLKGITSKENIIKLATLSESEKKRYEQLIVDLGVDPNKINRELSSKLLKLNQLIDLKKGIDSVITDINYSELNILKTTYDTYSRAANIAASELFKNDPFPDIGGDIWRTLWESARKYSESIVYIGRTFPVTENAKCVLCQQQIETEAANRLNRFHEFITADAKQNEKNAYSDYQVSLKLISKQNIPLKEIHELVSFVCNELDNKELSDKLHEFFVKAKWRLRSIIRLKSNIPTFPVLTNTILEQECEMLERHISDLAKVENIEQRQKLVDEKSALEDKIWLDVVKNDVLAEIERLKQIELLEKLIKQTSTSAITTKISEISEKLVTDALRAQFSKEIDSLKIASLAIELKQEKSSFGAAQFKVIMTRKPFVKVGQVLSEGEFRCIALAAFLAELATTSSESAIIFDDPVSSLDHRHREAVAKRLASESLKRQVIVFTHNLEFLFLLDEACRDLGAEINYRHITKLPDNSETGLCHNDAPPKAQNVNKKIQSIEVRLNNEKIHYQNGDEANWEKTARNLQEDLRFTWERAVEDILGVVLTRFSNKVDTLGLSQLTALTLNDCGDMRAAYGRISSWLHSDGVGLQRNLPLPSEIENEILILKKWHQDLKGRQSKINS